MAHLPPLSARGAAGQLEDALGRVPAHYARGGRLQAQGLRAHRAACARPPAGGAARMRVELGIAGVTVLLILAGQGVLLALGVTRLDARTLAASSGLAYLAGVASTMLLGILLLALGVTFSLPLFVVVALLLATSGAVVPLRRARASGGTRG